MRCFVAVPLSRTVASAIDGALDRSLRGIRWTSPENLHVTLKFLGEVEEARLEAVKEALGRIRAPAFEMGVAGMGIFPRIVWVGCTGPVAGLAAAVEEACAALGFPPERRAFTPHATIGRLKDPRAGRRLKLDPAASFGRQRVEAFRLMKSDPGSAGPVYSELAAFALGAPSPGSHGPSQV